MRARLAVVALALLVAGCGHRAPPPVDRSPVADDLLPAERTALAAHADAPFYRIDARLSVERRQVAGSQRVELINRAAVALTTACFRLTPNAPQYLTGRLAVDDVRVDGEPAASALSQHDTTLTVRLPRPLPPRGRVDVSCAFTATVPPVEHGFGIYRAGKAFFNLYGWHPTLAPLTRDGWSLPDIPPLGEPTDTDVADYLVDIAVPDGWTAVTTGASRVDANGTHAVAALARNFVVCAVTGYAHVAAEVDGTTVASWAPTSDLAGAKIALDAATRALAQFSPAFGAYPYRELDVVCTGLGENAGGMEATGLVMIDRGFYRQPATFAGLVVSHEVAHQWFYGLVGSDALNAPWQDESLASWCDEWFLERRYGAFVAQQARIATAEVPYKTALLTKPDLPLLTPAAALDETALGGFVYGKGELVYDRMRRDLGDERFLAFLGRYARENRFGRADLARWRAALAAEAGDAYADSVVARWITGAQPILEEPPSESR